ncbi:MAG TPA: DUF192 domain-containing protein [Candidatus Saccharimonadales bacterium]|jgi:hypothetical protein|nr:DUF192 domain-containing protein [Candidatus Saccharimonadales bacterium]
MFKQVLLPILAVIVFIIAVGIFVRKTSSLNLTGFGTPQPTARPEKTITIGSKTIQVQIADTTQEREQGLSGVSSLAQDKGMLFVFDTKVTAVFWMKDMLFPLDMIWIADGKIVAINKNIPKPAPNTPDNQLKTYSPGQFIDRVLEVNAGFADKNKIKVGDSVDLSHI